MKKKHLWGLTLVVVLSSLIFGMLTFATDDPEPWSFQPQPETQETTEE